MKAKPNLLSNFNLKKLNLKNLKVRNVMNMKYINDLMKPANKLEFSLAIIFVVYIIFNIKTPDFLVPLIDNNLGYMLVVLMPVLVLMCCNPILAVLAFIVAYLLIKRSSHMTPSYAMNNYLPSEDNKNKDFSKFNNFPTSLEEDIVNGMPSLADMQPVEDLEFKPVVDSTIESTHI